MHLNFPYNYDINTIEEAIYFIKNKCNNCDNQITCSGLSAKKCNEIVNSIIKEFSFSKIIELNFDKELKSLAGNPYGREIFETEIEPYLENNNKLIVKFPEHIERVAAGFVQGFACKLGVEKFKNKIEIIGSCSFVKNFYERLE